MIVYIQYGDQTISRLLTFTGSLPSLSFGLLFSLPGFFNIPFYVMVEEDMTLAAGMLLLLLGASLPPTRNMVGYLSA